MADEVNELIATSRPRLLNIAQLEESAQSIAANIRESQGRLKGKERNQFLRYARSSAEETDEHLRSNFAARRLAPKRYWSLHNRLVAIRKMLESMMRD